MTQYTYIIAGAGMSGLSMAYYLDQSDLVYDTILIIDQIDKKQVEKSWCYWSEKQEEFDAQADQHWDHLWFHTHANKSSKLSIAPFRYHRINSKTWENHVKSRLAKNPKIHWINAEITNFSYQGVHAVVETDNGNFRSTKKIFDSISPYPCDPQNPKELKQHFVGLTIESNFPVFETDAAHLFDFRIAFTPACEFMYVLPSDSRTALIEHTFFSGTLLNHAEYVAKIKDYLLAYYGLGEDDYLLIGEEAGIIPMNVSSELAQNLHAKIIKIGTSGGFVKASTGYSFLRTQRIIKQMVHNMEQKAWNNYVVPQNPFKTWMDRVLIQVLVDQKIKGNEVFEAMFAKNPPQRMLSFLDEQTSIWEDLRMMQTVPIIPFIQAAFKIMRHK